MGMTQMAFPVSTVLSASRSAVQVCHSAGSVDIASNFQTAAAAERKGTAEEVMMFTCLTHAQKIKTAKKVQKRERRETLQREAQQTERASEQAAHRLAGMRSRGESGHQDRSRQKSAPAPAPKMVSLDAHVRLLHVHSIEHGNTIPVCMWCALKRHLLSSDTPGVQMRPPQNWW